VLAAALLPLPGSPAISLPGRSGPTPNLLGMLVLLAAAVALTGPPRWSRRRLLLAAVATVPALVLAASAATFSLPVIVGLPGNRLALARDLAALVLGVVVLAGMSLWVAAALPRLPGVGAAAVVLAAVAVHGRVAPRLGRIAVRPVTAVAAAAALGSVVLGAVAAGR
jgi:hypothetical protein